MRKPVLVVEKPQGLAKPASGWQVREAPAEVYIVKPLTEMAAGSEWPPIAKYGDLI